MVSTNSKPGFTYTFGRDNENLLNLPVSTYDITNEAGKQMDHKQFACVNSDPDNVGLDPAGTVVNR